MIKVKLIDMRLLIDKFGAAAGGVNGSRREREREKTVFGR